MQNNKSLWMGLVVVAIIAIIALFTPAVKEAVTAFGSASDCQTNTCLTGGLNVSGDGIYGGGTLTVTTTANATSTLTTGCVQTYATSSATSIIMFPIATTTNVQAGNQGVMQWQYGTCPNL